MSAVKPRKRYGWAGWGYAYDQVGVEPGDRIHADGFGNGTVVPWDDPEVAEALEDGGPEPHRDDGYIYVELDDGIIDGFPPSIISKL